MFAITRFRYIKVTFDICILLLLGQRMPFVIQRSSLNRGLLNQGFTVASLFVILHTGQTGIYSNLLSLRNIKSASYLFLTVHQLNPAVTNFLDNLFSCHMTA